MLTGNWCSFFFCCFAASVALTWLIGGGTQKERLLVWTMSLFYFPLKFSVQCPVLSSNDDVLYTLAWCMTWQFKNVLFGLSISLGILCTFFHKQKYMNQRKTNSMDWNGGLVGGENDDVRMRSEGRSSQVHYSSPLWD